MQGQLKNVHQIHASDFAFAAILGDGLVVTWGQNRFGGDKSAVQDWHSRSKPRSALLLPF